MKQQILFIFLYLTVLSNCSQCPNNQIYNSQTSYCECPENSYLDGDYCIFCHPPKIVNNSQDGCDCQIPSNQALFDIANCNCINEARYDEGVQECSCIFGHIIGFDLLNCKCSTDRYIVGPNLNECIECTTQCICPVQCTTCVHNQLCTSCEDGYYLAGDNMCYQCDNKKCGTCSGGSQNCIQSCGIECETCDNNGQCLTCPTGNYLQNNTCKPCDSSCPETCEGNATFCVANNCENCFSCTGNICNACDLGYFNDGNGVCQQCDHSVCATCDTSATNCIEFCPDNCELCNTNGECLQCEPQYYINSNNTCDFCDNTQCALCTGSRINCTATCQQDCATCNSQGHCQTCFDGYYLEWQGTNCFQCDYNVCHTCIGSATHCVDAVCNNTCVDCDKFGDCTTCEDGQFVNSSKVCQNCDHTICATCQNQADQCIISCGINCARCDVFGDCQECDQQYFLNGDGDCEICDNTICAECSGSSTNCTASCNSGCETCNGNGVCTSCPDGKFLELGGNCTDCDNTLCATCSGSSTNCDNNCMAGCKECGIDSKCISCPDGFYLTSTRLCSQCETTQCATCTGSATSCDISCQSGCLECDETSFCTACPDGFFLDTNTNLCVQCDNTICATCSNSATNCDIFCQNGCLECNTGGFCTSCPDGFFLDTNSNTCSQCDTTQCAICSDSATNCDTSCQPGCQECDETSFCTNCPDGYFLDTNTKLCIQCDNTICATCSGSASNCDSNCQPGCQDCGSDGFCTSCPPGYFLNINTNLCDQCDTTYCATCSNSSTNCDSDCDSSCQECNSIGNCTSCHTGYFLDSTTNLCLQCDNTQCATCTNSATNCDSQCDNSCQECGPDGLCTSCPPQYFLDSNSNLCLLCDITRCATCSGSATSCDTQCHNSCQECDNNGLCTTCQDGYFLDSNTDHCVQCDNTQCATCQNSADNCLILCNNGCSQCSPTGDCSISCVFPCDNCTEPTTCTSCQGNYRSPPECNCDDGYYLDGNNCVECDEKCSTCDNQNNCITCSQNRDINNSCQCLNTFYEDNNLICQQCQPPCLECDNQSECITCDIQNKIPPLCDQCSVGFYQGQDSQCFECSYKCISCSNNDNQCQQCKPNRDQNNNCMCLPGYSEDSISKECILCPQFCKSCSSTQGCQECLQGYFLNQQNNTCEECLSKCLTCKDQPENCVQCKSQVGRKQQLPCDCEDRYYEQNQTKTCQKCPQQCLTCMNDNICSTCTNIYFHPPLCLQSRNSFFTIQENNREDDGYFQFCEIQCETCSQSPKHCDICSIGQNRLDYIPECPCIKGYHSENNKMKDCIKCSNNCQECENSQKCLLCDSNRNRQLNLVNSDCECQQGFKENENKECQKCYLYKNQCLFKCPKTTQQNEKTSTCDQKIQILDENGQIITILGCIFLAITLLLTVLLMNIKFGTKQILKENDFFYPKENIA